MVKKGAQGIMDKMQKFIDELEDIIAESQRTEDIDNLIELYKKYIGMKESDIFELVKEFNKEEMKRTEKFFEKIFDELIQNLFESIEISNNLDIDIEEIKKNKNNNKEKILIEFDNKNKELTKRIVKIIGILPDKLKKEILKEILD